MDITDFQLSRLEETTQIKSFKCTDSDLNDFLIDDAVNYHRELMGVTYIIHNADSIVAYYTLLNDKITRNEQERSVWNRLNRGISDHKRRAHYPAVKIGRLAVHETYSNNGLGSQILAFLKVLFTTGNRTGCRFITVDAYRAALPFYERNGFHFLTQKDQNDQTRLMFFDLKRFNPTILK